MKLKNIRIKKYKLLRLYLAKYEVYKKGQSSLLYISDKLLDRLELSFKKVLFLIHQYHICNKRILFVGLPYSTNRVFVEVLLKSKHIFIPKSVWLKGLLGNRDSISKESKTFLYFKNFLKIKNNPHLIVLFNELSSSNLLLESSKLNIPMVFFGDGGKGLENIPYLIEGTFLRKKIKSFYQFLIYSILKKRKNKVLIRKQKKILHKKWPKRKNHSIKTS